MDKPKYTIKVEIGEFRNEDPTGTPGLNRSVRLEIDDDDVDCDSYEKVIEMVKQAGFRQTY